MAMVEFLYKDEMLSIHIFNLSQLRATTINTLQCLINYCESSVLKCCIKKSIYKRSFEYNSFTSMLWL